MLHFRLHMGNQSVVSQANFVELCLELCRRYLLLSLFKKTRQFNQCDIQSPTVITFKINSESERHILTMQSHSVVTTIEILFPLLLITFSLFRQIRTRNQIIGIEIQIVKTSIQQEYLRLHFLLQHHGLKPTGQNEGSCVGKLAVENEILVTVHQRDIRQKVVV